MTFFKRHAWQLSLYAFFISPLISEIDPIIISIDPIGNTAYSLEPYFPSFQRDLHVYDIRVNGELGLPLSTFVFDIEESPVILYDSLRTRSTFNFIKGDYGFRDLSVKTQSLTLNGGTLTGFAHTRSYEGVNILRGKGSLMQNYLLNYSNNFKNSDFSITTAYHNEGMNEPISNDDFIAKVNESYFTGLTFNTNTHFGQFSYHSDLQISETETEIDENEEWISTQSAVFDFNSRGRYTPFLNWSQNGENQSNYRVGSNFGDSLTHVRLNLAYINTLQIEFLFSLKFRNAYIQLERKIFDDYTDYSQGYILNSLMMGAKKNGYYFQLGPNVLTSDGYSYNSYFGGCGYRSDIVMFNFEGKFFNNSSWPLNEVISSDLKIHFPYFERYTPFIKTEYSYYSQQDSESMEAMLASETMEIDYGEVIENVHRLNIEFGVNLETFKVSYHYMNILGEDGRFIEKYERIPLHKYLKVEWKFRN